MDFSSTMSEISEASETNGKSDRGFSQESLDKFDALFEGDGVDEKEEFTESKDEISTDTVNDKFEKMFAGDDGDNNVENTQTPDIKQQEGDENINSEDGENRNDTDERSEGLTDEEKQKIKDETGWSDEIIDNIRSMKEYEIYKEAGLKEEEIGGRKVLIRSDIDWNQVDEKGRTNTERIERGLAPLDKEGNPIELHHIGQREDSPLAELTFKEHRCDGNDTILHDKTKDTETHGEGNTWNSQKQEHWKNRAEYNEQMSETNGGENNG